MTEEEKNVRTIFIGEEADGERLDRALPLFMPEISRNQIQKSIENGKVKIDGTICFSKKHPVREGEKVEVSVDVEEEPRVEGQNIPLEVLFEDEHLMVVNKPKGMVVYPGVGNQDTTLVNAILHHCGGQLSSVGGSTRPGIVHRIDKDTSGLLVVAKNNDVHRALGSQMKAHTVTRGYKAIVHNAFREEEGRIDLPIGRDPKRRLRRKVGTSDARNAITCYRVLENIGQYAFVEVCLETGRTHQIRVHMSHINHPVLGDSVYGPPKNPLGVRGQMLHAYRLGFTHPVTEKWMAFQSPLPEEFQEVLEKLKRTKK